ncbi:hypothetical protein M413DRAFT_410670 [Hebeloma cylindrosporum]|uniref:Uncharacterized protein n=1 Tax=Hebeloma cylindrosporum TaxID=76867 RepID=A0A0C2XWP1_HEBCY|nr:hypothetical protein M413DRAFT_410670 [Hebeloma cylindrosporum h7]
MYGVVTDAEYHCTSHPRNCFRGLIDSMDPQIKAIANLKALDGTASEIKLKTLKNNEDTWKFPSRNTRTFSMASVVGDKCLIENGDLHSSTQKQTLKQTIEGVPRPPDLIFPTPECQSGPRSRSRKVSRRPLFACQRSGSWIWSSGRILDASITRGRTRLSLTEEEKAELAKELAEKYSRRRLGTNADRYKEEEPELDSDGEPMLEAEVDLSAFLEKHRISDNIGPSIRIAEAKDYDDDDAASKKRKVEQIVWDEELDTMNREKKAAEATWDLNGDFARNPRN